MTVQDEVVQEVNLKTKLKNVKEKKYRMKWMMLWKH